MTGRKASPADTQKIAAHARQHLECEARGAAPASHASGLAPVAASARPLMREGQSPWFSHLPKLLASLLTI
jgi:hypothetical protein